jgi:hypothetical protein
VSALDDARAVLAEWDLVLGLPPEVGRLVGTLAALVAEREHVEVALKSADEALRLNIVHWIACSDLLDEPFSDAPGQSPWTRSGKRAVDQAAAARTMTREALEA